LYVDDPVSTFAGTSSSCSEALDLLACWWLALGLPLAWAKGTFSTGSHQWIGAAFSHKWVQGVSACSVAVPQKFANELFELLGPFAAGSGSIPEATVDRMLGKAGRLSYIVPGSRPYVAALWGALAASRAANAKSRREAAPNQHAARRFASAAVWLRTLLRPPGPAQGLLPLEQIVLLDLPPISKNAPAIQADASPWGGGAILFIDRLPREYVMMTWTPRMAEKMRTRIGDSAGQTSWEYFVLFVALQTWASDFRSGLLLLGDNLSSLAGILNLRGRGGALNAITKEIAWRRVRYGWRFAAGHLPTERNKLADSLSRVAAPSGSEQRSFPEELSSARAREAPDFESLWVCS